jgi:hypothetical protein
MSSLEKDEAILQTQKWINNIVIGLNLCPFAAREVKRKSINYEISSAKDIKLALKEFQICVDLLNDNPQIETLFLIFPESFTFFSSYLKLVDEINIFLKKKKYLGIYQVASFHPNYLFQNAKIDDPANYTNRSPYPMLHLLREESIAKATAHYINPEKIPNNNILLTRELGVEKIKAIFNLNEEDTL